MTDEEKTLLREAHKAATNVERYLFKPDNPKRPSRADTLDKIIDGLRAGKLSYRILLGFLALIAAMGAAWAYAKGLWT